MSIISLEYVQKVKYSDIFIIYLTILQSFNLTGWENKIFS